MVAEEDPATIAAWSGRSLHSVKVMIARLEGKREPHNKGDISEKTAAIRADLALGIPQAQVARNHGVSRQYVYQLKEGIR